MLVLKPETEALAQRLAEVRKLSVDDAIRRALERDLPISAVEGTPDTLAVLRANLLDDFVDRLSRVPVRDSRSGREIMDDLDPL